MNVVVVGASGRTGRLLVNLLLECDAHVRAVVRSPSKLPDALRSSDRLSVHQGSVLEMDDAQLLALVDGCDAVVSCLGHEPSFKGVFGHPRMLVRDTTRRLCEAIMGTGRSEPVRFVLMNTAGVGNRDLSEKIPVGQRVVMAMLRLLLPPHLDNERAADWLRLKVGQSHGAIRWACVRPDTLIDHPSVTEYTVHPSPTRSAIFNAGVTSRINLGHFMAELITREEVWARWNGRMPVVYDREQTGTD